jgi:hypothetical protein
MQHLSRLLGIAVLAAVFLNGPEAGAQTGGKNIIVYNFSGKGASAARDKIVKALINQGYSLASRKTAKEVALGMGHSTVPADAAVQLEIAKSMNLDAFVSGKLKVKGKNRTLSVEVYALCENGIVHPLEYEWVGGKIPEDTVVLAANQIDGEIQSAVQSCWAATQVPVEPEVTPAPPKEEKKKGKLAFVKGEGGPHCKLGGIRCWLPPALLFDLGFLVSSRSLEIPAGSLKYRYEGSAYPLFGLDLSLGIGRFFKKNPMFCLTLLFDFAHSFALTSHPMDDSSVDIDTKDIRIKVGLGLEVAPKPDSLPLWISIDLGWGMQDFLVEYAAPNPYISDFNYRFVDIGLGVRADIVKRWLDVRIRMGFRAPYTLGEAEGFYGSGAKTRFGFNAGIRLGGVIVYGFHWALGFDYIGYVADFTGDGDITASGYPSGESLKDFYPTGYFMLGYRL